MDENTNIITYTNSPFISITSGQVPLKLTATNFRPWSAQFDPFLIGWDLKGYIDGSLPCPPSTDPSYKLWVRQDNLLLHGIRIFVSESIVTLITSSTTSKEAWDKLTRIYENRSRSGVMNLKDRLMRPRESCRNL